MVLLDQIARSSTIAILATVAFVLLRDGRRIPVAGAAVGFFVTIAAHLVLTSPDYTAVRGLDTALRDERAYRQEGLTIAVLSRQLDVPEYRLRRVINQQLGYRNFNAFVNDCRIDDACRVLADPTQERLPILNLALDLGYGSPGAFNRAFRAKTGQTPTEYRRSRLGVSPEPLAES